MDKLPKFAIETGYLFGSKEVLIKCGNIGSKTGNSNIARETYFPGNKFNNYTDRIHMDYKDNHPV
tara:strand:- start:15 stop:209 length:195 start_codon:yes stop_codon:yes gene_type:complete